MPLLRNPHLMTIAPTFVPRGFGLRRRQVERMLIPVAPESQILALAHFQPDFLNCPTLVLVHGLEGSADSYYMVGLAEKALAAGANVVRVNLRNCGDTLHLTPTLYNAGLSQDIVRVVEFLADQRGLGDLFLIGYSLGGNLVLKASAELGELAGHVSATVAISPPIDLEPCVRALELRANRIYELKFLWSLKRKIQKKDKLFPKCFRAEKLAGIKSVREFDNTFTAPDGNYGTADNYYRDASSRPLLGLIRVPTLIVAAQDDPLVPFVVFDGIETEYVKLLGPTHGGHAGFVHHLKVRSGDKSPGDHFWADGQVLDFCFKHSKLLNDQS
jgi:predicted alpha/beta-fold hydrolase